MADLYSSMDELFTQEPRAHYRLTTRRQPLSKVLVVSPHGGSIEKLTSEIADTVAGENFKYHDFAGRMPHDNFARLHVTSRNYDCLLVEQLNRDSEYTLTIHGCQGRTGIRATYLGGKDLKGRALVRKYLEQAGFTVTDAPPPIAGMGDDNIVNRNLRSMGIQLELSGALRKQFIFEGGPSKSGNSFHRYCKALRGALSELSGEAL